ncbi:ImmA/IrrE family metallo-endopeptidase [Kitasatospora xanthocidica]|uniref:ImmA/IrrE family metallo-endopeptidase n=1 Tax=Kitasatospora xanthocidica TaxID=83382 RepID=UPI0036E42F73
MASIPALVEPAVLRWARRSIGLDTVAAARKIGVPDDRIEKWEAGDEQPTIAQLKSAATAYKRPLAVFFLAEPPQGFDAMRDFRRHDESDGEWSPELHGEYRRALLQRDNSLELFELDDALPSSSWIVSLPGGSDDDLARAARKKLLGATPVPLPTGSGGPYEHLNTWVSALEEAGVLVMATHGGKVKTREMRAFSLYFETMPVIMLNGADSARGRLFSLLHEYAHLLLHTGGLCDMIADTKATSIDRQLEARCNAIAASILMPAELVLRRPEVVARVNRQGTWDYEALRSAAAPFGTSAEAFLRRLVVLGRVSHEFYSARRPEFLATYEAEESRSKAGGGNWYRNQARDLGKGYVRHVADAHRRRVIDSYTAATYLNVKVGQIERLARTAAIQEPV